MDLKLKQKIINIRRHLHMFPELGNKEFKTTLYIEKILSKLGIKTKRLTQTGIIGLIEGISCNVSKKRCIALRADIDALPISEKNKKVYASKYKGVMHACGHDANTAIVLGAADILSKQRDKIDGRVKLIFQPNEENSGGAKALIDAGVLKDPDVDVILGMHVNPWLAPGVIGFKQKEMMAAVDKIKIEIIGEGGHGAYPHLGKDTILIASHIVIALQNIVSREIDPLEPAVISIGSINGGDAFNILANKVTLIGTVRVLNEKLHKDIHNLIERKIESIVRGYNADYRYNYEILGYPLKNSDDILEICKQAAITVVGEKNIKFLDKPSMGGEDFAEYLRYVPGCFMFLGTSLERSYPWHSERFDVNEESLIYGSMVLAEIVRRLLNSK